MRIVYAGTARRVPFDVTITIKVTGRVVVNVYEPSRDVDRGFDTHGREYESFDVEYDEREIARQIGLQLSPALRHAAAGRTRMEVGGSALLPFPNRFATDVWSPDGGR